jgi:hypothetical protein
MPVTSVGAPSPRIRHGVASFVGRVLLSGGTNVDNTGAMNDVFFYDPGVDRWSPAPPLNQARCAHSAAGSYVFDGLSDCSNGTSTTPRLEQYVPPSVAWKVITIPNNAPPTPRYNASATVLPSGELLVFGGAGSSFSATASGGRFDGLWRDASCDVAGCAAGSPVLLVLNGTSVVSWDGGNNPTGVIFDIKRNLWSSWTPPAETPHSPRQYADDGHRWYVLTGDSGSDCPSTVTVHIFDEARGQWTIDTAPAPTGLALESDGSNTTVWVGSEVFTWSARCNPSGFGARYQPPAPAP